MRQLPGNLRTALVAALLATGGTALASAQDAPRRGPTQVDPRWHALVHATLVPEPGEVIEDATVVLRDGVVVSVRAGGPVPDGARVWDCSDLFVFPGFLEAYLPVDAPRPSEDGAGTHWQYEMVVPQRSALDGEGVDGDTREELRALGFTSAAIAPRDGVLRGLAAIVSLAEPGDELAAEPAEVLARDVYQSLSFDRVGWGGDGLRYPTSQMGAIALARQTLLDADRHQKRKEIYAHDPAGHEPPAVNHALDALARGENGGTPLLFDARDELQLLRAARLAGEFSRPLVALGSGTEYRRLDAVAGTLVPIVVPLAFPEAPDVSTRHAADAVSLRRLMAWEQAPTNLGRLVDAGVTVALTTHRLDERGEFLEHVREAMEHGVDADAALAMLTTTPARLLGVEDRLGRVRPGMLAHLVVADGPPLGEDTEIRDVWVGGRRHEVNPPPGPDRTGNWSFAVARIGDRSDVAGRLVIDDGDEVRLEIDDLELEARNVRTGKHHLHFHVEGEELGLDGVVSCSGLFEGEELHGALVGPDGERHHWSATRTGPVVADAEEEDAGEDAEDGATEDAGEDDAEVAATDVPESFGLPFGAYGLDGAPEQRTVLVHGATIWTGGPAGVVDGAVLVVEDGRVRYVGPRELAPVIEGVEEIDATGKHVTPGIIDCHSHTGVSGSVNEGGRRVTSEVRIADVIDPDDISWYRQLAGGTTAANQLHGSANAIGGQNSVVKIRWGVRHPDDMRLEGAPPGIKFALGENPKRVAQNTDVPDEYPQTRMGVEALIRDRLNAGRDYGEEWAAYRALSEWERRTTMPPRRDLELEALAEIVAGERLIHCHSYRQDEILMLARMAQEFGFTLGTFQHVLEGYKVADAIAESALGGSTFSDWWAYKFEVIDAIPHNAAIMTEVGVNVSINSDSDEHARRLNTEAGKGVKYGGMDPHAALQMVTLNPAIQLGVADRVGSLEPGKDADFAIWSGSPLSYASRCESTWIDGREYFSLEQDRALREEAARERERIIQKLLESGASGESRGGGRGRGRPSEATFDEREERLRQRFEAMWRAGIDPDVARPGECGCYDWFLYGTTQGR